jgi:hypothetical protein
MTMKNLPSKGLYQHFKGNYYKVLDVARHSETQEYMVVYKALYGPKEMWVRPLSMFTESVQRDGKMMPRFRYCEPQTESLEMAILNVLPNQNKEFERAFKQAQKIIQDRPGYISHRLEKRVEQDSQYLLLVEWQSIEDHTQGFRKSAEYQQWKALLHHFYAPFPEVMHFNSV